MQMNFYFYLIIYMNFFTFIYLFINFFPRGLHKGISIDDLNADVIIQATSIFINLKINKFNEILFVHKWLNINQLKAHQTYIKRSSFYLSCIYG